MSGALLAKTEGIHGQSSALCLEKSLELQEELFSLFGSTEMGTPSLVLSSQSLL